MLSYIYIYHYFTNNYSFIRSFSGCLDDCDCEAKEGEFIKSRKKTMTKESNTYQAKLTWKSREKCQ